MRPVRSRQLRQMSVCSSTARSPVSGPRKAIRRRCSRTRACREDQRLAVRMPQQIVGSVIGGRALGEEARIARCRRATVSTRTRRGPLEQKPAAVAPTKKRSPSLATVFHCPYDARFTQVSVLGRS